MKLKKLLSLNKVDVGSVLATDVCDLQGNCLVSAGQPLSKEILGRLQKRHIDVVTVWNEQSLSKTESAEQQAVISARLAHRFRQMQDNSDMRRLHDLLRDWCLQSFTTDDGESS